MTRPSQVFAHRDVTVTEPFPSGCDAFGHDATLTVLCPLQRDGFDRVATSHPSASLHRDESGRVVINAFKFTHHVPNTHPTSDFWLKINRWMQDLGPR